MISKELHARVIEKLEKVIEIAEDHHQTTFKFPTIVYRKRGTTAGTADTRAWTLDFNGALYEQNVEDFLARTVPHEMAHLMDCQMNPESHQPQLKGYRRNGRAIYKRDIHGYSWKRMMVLIGANPSRCHSYDTSHLTTRRSEKFIWICSVHGTEMKLGPGRHRTQMSTPGGAYTPRRTLCGRGCSSKFQYKDATAPIVPVVVTGLLRAAQTKTTRKSSRNDGTTIRSKAAKIFWLDGTRSIFIERCINNLGMKKSTASTYHHNFKSGKWSV